MPSPFPGAELTGGVVLVCTPLDSLSFPAGKAHLVGSPQEMGALLLRPRKRQGIS